MTRPDSPSIRLMFGALVATIGLLAAGPSRALPAKVEIAYEVLRNGSAIADVTTRFEQDGAAYRIVEDWKGRGILSLRGEAQRTSRGELRAGGLRPLEFVDRRGRNEDRARFDWSAKTVLLTHKGESRAHALPAGAQDRLSFNLQFVATAPQAGRSIPAAVADGRDLSEHVYDAATGERLRLAGGEWETVKMVRRRGNPTDRGVEIWFDRARGIPLRILVLDKDGTRLDQVATRIAIQ